jgi:hypothetical protein
MSRDTGFDGRDIEWHNKGFNKDIDFDKSKESRDKNITKEPNCGSPMGFISSLQEISVQENLLDGSIDKNLFTLQKTICALRNGMNLGFTSSLTIILHIVFCYIFSFEYGPYLTEIFLLLLLLYFLSSRLHLHLLLYSLSYILYMLFQLPYLQFFLILLLVILFLLLFYSLT